MDAPCIPDFGEAAPVCAARRFDIFARSEERRTERRLIGEYEAVIDEIVARLTPANHAIAVELASLPLEIRGFGHIKEANLARAKAKRGDSSHPLRAPASPHALGSRVGE